MGRASPRACPGAAPWLLASAAAIGAVGALLRRSWATASPSGAAWGDALWASVCALSGTGLFARTEGLWSPAGRAVLAGAALIGALATVWLYLDRVWLIRAPLAVRGRMAVRVAGAALAAVFAGAAALAPSLGPGAALRTAIGALTQTGWVGPARTGAPLEDALRVYGIVLPLSLIGALGVPLLAALMRRRPRLHTRAALGALAAVYLIGTAALLAPRLMPIAAEALEIGVTANRPEAPGLAGALARGAADASFDAVSALGLGTTARPMDQAAPARWATLLALMAAGGAGGGTAGGIGLASCAVLGLGTIRLVRGRGAAGWTRPLASVAALATLLAVPAGAAIFLLALVEPVPLGKIAFATTAALTNAGIDAGIAPTLTTLGQTTLAVLMVIGRLAPPLLLGRALAPKVGRGAGRRLYLG